MMPLLNISPTDSFALGWFLVCWFGYSWFANWKARNDPSLLGVMYTYRRRWITRMLEREQRIVDAATLSNLLHGSTFFASTTIFILGGLIALLGTTEQVITIVSELPFTRKAPHIIWEAKILLLIAIFVYAFFKFTWSLRQFNFCSVLVVAAPAPTSNPEDHEGYINLTANIASFASDNFNQGLRAYYFGLAALTWFLHPWLFMTGSATVTYILYQREFHSRTLYALINKYTEDVSKTSGGTG